MTRFAGSRAPQISAPNRSGERRNFSDNGLGSAGYTYGGEASDAVSVGSAFGAVRSASPKYDEIATTAAKARSQEKTAAMEAEANMVGAGINAAATVEAAEEQAKAYGKMASATETAGIMTALGSIAGAAMGLSDEDTKHTIDKIEDALEVLRNLRPVTFYYKEEYSASPHRLHHGFIAQEYQKFMPDATYFDESIGKLCIDTNELIALLVRANQQLETRITRIEAKQALRAV